MKRRFAAAAAAICLLTAMPWAAAAAPPATNPSPGGNLLTDTAVWDITLFHAYCKGEWSVDIADKVATYPGQDLVTSDYNGEFVKRMEAALCFYQAGGQNDLGITPDGAVRTPQQQNDLYKIGRIPLDGDKNSNVKDDWVKPKTPGKITPVTGDWVGWHNFGLAVDLCQYSGKKPTLVADVTGKLGWTVPNFMYKPWQNLTTDVAPDLGFTWGGWWQEPHDLFHFEWHPNRHNPAQLEITGLPDPQFSDLYTSKIPPTIYFWSGDKQTPDANDQVLRVITVVYDQHWIAVKSERYIEHRKDGYWTGFWRTYDPPAHLVPGYEPVRHFLANQNNPYWLDKFAYKSHVHCTSYIFNTDSHHPGRSYKSFSSYDVTANFCPRVNIFDWQTMANVDINMSHPRTPKPPDALKVTNAKLYNAQLNAHNAQVKTENALINEYAAIADTSTYDIEAGPVGFDPPHQKTDMAMRGTNIDEDGYTSNDPDQVWHTYTIPPGPLVRFAWVRPTGQIGVQAIADDQKHPYDPLNVRSLRVYKTNAFEMVSPTLPDGAFDQPNPPPWPKNNPPPKPTPQNGPTNILP
jgi:hypothetical protein